MANDMKLTGPVRVESDSRHRVALELLEKIAFAEKHSNSSPPQQSREYFQTLYLQCFRVTGGYPPDA